MQLYIHDYAGHVGQLEVARALAARGHDVVFSYCDELGTPRADLAARQSGLQIEAIGIGQAINKKNYLKRQWQDVLYARALKKHVRQFQPDVALSANNPLIPQRALLNDCRRRRVPLVHWWTDIYALAVKHGVGSKYGPLGPTIASAYLRLETKLLNASHEIIAIAPQFQPIADSWRITTPLTVIPVAAPTDQIQSGTKDNAWSQRHGLAKTTNILYCGTLGNKHNPHLLLELAASLTRHEEARVVVASQGVGANWLSEQQKQKRLANLVLLPFQSFEDYPEVLATADVHVSIINEDAASYALPSKVMSQLCAGRPQVAAAPDDNYVANIIAEADAGVVCAPSDSVAFRSAIFMLLDDHGERERLGANGRRYAEERLSLATLTPHYEAVLSRLIAR